MYVDLKTSVYFKICKTLFLKLLLLIILIIITNNNKYNDSFTTRQDIRWNFIISNTNLKANN